MLRIGKSSQVRFAIVSYLISTLAIIGYMKITFHMSAMHDLVIGLIAVPTTIYYTLKVIKMPRPVIWRALDLSFTGLKRYFFSTLIIVGLFGYIGYSTWQINDLVHEKSGRKSERIYSTARRKRSPRSRLKTSKYVR